METAINDYSYNTPKLSSRLKMVAQMVPPCERVIDVGTDHAFIPIYLIADNRCKKAIASDIRKGPADLARRNVEKYQMEDEITVVVGDGLRHIEIVERDSVVIAGMGGYEIASILSAKPFKASILVLQPQKSLRELRLFLSGNGYSIIDEKIVKETNHFYVAMAVKFTGNNYRLSLTEQEIGPCLLKNSDEIFHEYLLSRIIRLKKQVIGDPKVAEVIVEVEKLLQNYK